MTLLEIRTQLVKVSGRFDLVANTTSYADDGADFFIQAGQRMLDTLLDTPKSSAEFRKELPAGDYKLSFSEARAIKGVWVISDDDGIEKLRRNTIDELREKYGEDGAFGDVDDGTPRDWGLAITRREAAVTANETGVEILLLPPAETAMDIIVEALYLSPKLSDDADESWWSINYPDLLIQAALYKAETFLRNTQGARDWLEALQMAVTLIDHDQVEQAIAQVDQMKNSWNFRKDLPRRSRDFGTL